MRRSTNKILTTHVGALPGPLQGTQTILPDDELGAAVGEVVRLQRSAGIDFVNEGELTKGGNFVTFVNSRLSGFEAVDAKVMGGVLTASQDWIEFADFYGKALKGGTLFEQTASVPNQIPARSMELLCRGPIQYVGTTALQREIDALRSALGSHPPADAFLTTTAPASVEVGRTNEHYRTQEEFVFALADALKVEYEAIAAAGFQLQIDDAWLAALWDRIGIQMGLSAYKNYCMMRVEALNHALTKIPEDQIRYHLCWGSWHGPHLYDIPMADIVDVMLAVKAQTYLFEAANVRHEHEYALWKEIKLPTGKTLAPGVVTHSTPLIEHPELVSQRIQRFAKAVGAENVIASTDCGLGLRCHPQIAWAKLKSLAEGAALASKALF
jgi:5-methyltetrahydropteroyltriglutamate--homocysteine methyltransferase